ncbi:MAG: hypothetical protein JWQ25_1617, partial [Daejeonella sp.]|nr:hypothetical protein [Daejeonella sp.]
SLDDVNKPHIVLITNNYKDYKIAETKIDYPFISFQVGSGERNGIFQIINKITNRIIGKKLFAQKIENLDAVFPYYKCVQQSLAKKKVYWIPDFQEHFASDFFSAISIEERKRSQLEIISSSETLIVSSDDALQHFESLYPNHTVQVNVLPFAVTHPNYKQLNTLSLIEKFDLPDRYFICPNQFWKHKNHFTVIEAINELKHRGIDVTVAFTGKTDDYRYPTYFSELSTYIEEHNLINNIKFLGFIDRSEQLQLMQNSIAIIQPSLFEGWSTVVEDAKAMNKFLIVSNINVHKEQLPNSNAKFFSPLSIEELASAIEEAYKNSVQPQLFDDNIYEKNIKKFGEKFLKVSLHVE